MAKTYEEVIWKNRQGTGLNRFKKSEETSDSVLLTNEPDVITEQGTPFSVENMNHIEKGIADAHELIANEIENTKEFVIETVEAEAQARNQAVSAETSARNQAITAETSARNQAITNEANTRAAADTNLQNNINETNSNVADLRYDFNAWRGRGGFIDAYNFGTANPTQQQLTNYALSQIPTISDPLQIWDSTKVRNLYDDTVWVLTNTQDTNPPIFEWSPQGSFELSPFSPGMGGYIVGANQNAPMGRPKKTATTEKAKAKKAK